MKVWGAILLFLVLGMFAWLASCGVALSYPSMVRYGYTSCSSCHVSPTGGGATTGYGRMAGEEMATWSKDGWGQLFGRGGLEVPDWVTAGADIRYMDIETPTSRQAFWMQEDAELAVRLSPEILVDASAGFYGQDPRPESRRSFVLWTPRDYVSVRAGRFFAAYGIMVPDHTAATRERLGFGEGRESYNAELSLHGEIGDLTVTEAVASGSSLTLAKDPDYQTRALSPAYMARGTVYAAKSLAVGGSYCLKLPNDPASPIGQDFGPFALWGMRPDLYLLAEVDRQIENGQLPEDVTFTELGYEVYRGVSLEATHEWAAGSRYGLGVQWFPVPHIELNAKAKYQDGAWLAEYLLHLNW